VNNKILFYRILGIEGN